MFPLSGFALSTWATDRCQSVPHLKGKKQVLIGGRPNTSPAVTDTDQSAQRRQNVIDHSGDRTHNLIGQSGSGKHTINTQSDKVFQNPLTQSGATNQHTFNNSGSDSLRESRPVESNHNHSNRSSRQSSPKPDLYDQDQGQGQRFKNKVLPQYGDLEGLLPPHQYSSFHVCFSQETRTDLQDSNCADSAKGYSDNHTDNSDNPMDNSDSPIRGACNIEREGANTATYKDRICYDEDLEINGADSLSDFDTWSQNTPVQIIRRESSTISDFTTLTDTSPLVKLEMKRMSTGSIKGYENPTFESSGHFELKDFKEDGLLDPTPVKRYRTESQRSQCSIQDSNDLLNSSLEQQLRSVDNAISQDKKCQ